jgi:hypothetical protein
MTASLSAFLDLTPEQATAQWTRILRREWPGPGRRQQDFLAVEVVLCFGLFHLLNPHAFAR